MPSIVNPHAAVLIKGAEDWFSDDESTRLDMEIEIEKDLDGEPNEAEVTIYNLNSDTRSRIIDPAMRDTPIEIYFAPFGTDELVKCFVGEITKATSVPERPGYSTELLAKSQHWQQRAKYIDKTTYEAGTPIEEIINFFVEKIDLTSEISEMPSGGILLAQSFSGPAFTLLQKFVWTYGYFCYINDGILYISGVYDPSNPSVINITYNMMATLPQPTERVDAVDVTLHTITDTNQLNPFAKKTRRNKRKWKKQALSRNDYVEWEAIDDVIFGITCDTLGTPSLQPDNIVKFEGDENQYRVQVVRHKGNTRQGFTTTIEADLYEGDTLYEGSFGDDRKTPEVLKQQYLPGQDLALPGIGL